MARRFPLVDDGRSYVLANLYVDYHRDGLAFAAEVYEGESKSRALAALFSDQFGSKFGSSVCDYCLNQNYVSYTEYVDPEQMEEGVLFQLTDKGVQHVENLIKNGEKLVIGVVDGADDELASLGFISSRADVVHKKSFEFSNEYWKSPDHLGKISEDNLEEVRKLLQECLKAIEGSHLSQIEQSQAHGQVAAAQSIAETPVPKLAWIKRILTPLSHVSEIAGLIRKVLELLG